MTQNAFAILNQGNELSRPESLEQLLSGVALLLPMLDAKTRELISIAVAVTTRCDGCITVHADAAIKAGASREEIAATLATAISLNAGAAYIYSLRALEAYDTLKK